jgi:MFS family permease
LISISIPTPPFWFFPIVFSFGGQYQFGFTLAHVFDSFSRPLGSAVFGHYGDKVGRKTTLVIALLTMGISTAYWFYLVMPASESLSFIINAMLWPCWFRR